MVLIEYIKKYKVTYISVVITFIIGLILGIFVTFKIPSKDKIEINNYLQELSEKITECKVDRSHLFKEKLADNIKYRLASWMYCYCWLYNLYSYGIQRIFVWLHNYNCDKIIRF